MITPRRCLGALAALCCSASSLLASLSATHTASAPMLPSTLDDQVKEIFDLRDYTLQPLALPDSVSGPLTVRVRLGDRDVDVALAPYSMRADSFAVYIDAGDGQLQPVEAPALSTMRGDVLQLPDSRVRAALVHGALSATIDLPDGSTWAIQQVAAEIPGVDPRMHIVYREREIAPPPGYRCGVDDAPAKPAGTAGRGSALRPVGGSGQAPRNVGDRICDIAFDADVEYYQSLSSNVQAVVNDIESIMNAIEGIYENNTDISYEVTTIIVRTAEQDPYNTTNPGSLLTQLASHWSGNLSAIRRDVAHLFTGKNIDGGVIGIANLSAICSNSNGYGLSQSRYTSNIVLRRSLTAHELGHNWSAQHCDNSGSCNIMCSCNGCGAPACTGNFTSFGAGEAAQIVAFRNSRTCLFTEPTPITAPFFDDLPASTVDTNKWIYVDGVVTSTASVNPPSPTRALQLNATGAGLYDDDEIRSHFIQLVGVTTPQLNYFVEARGVPTGKQLFVEIWLSTFRWMIVNTITSDGVDDTGFTQFTTNLNTISGAVHNEFRVRFRCDVDSTAQTWYVDNVYVGAPQGPATGACCLSDGTCVAVTSANCSTQGGAYQGDNSICGGVVCPQPPGACCLNAGGCVTALNLALCLSQGGVWQGSGTSCGTAGCAEPPGACCLANGTCIEVADAAACSAMGGVFQGEGTLCEETNCPQPNGACCLADGSCVTTDAAGCAAQGGSFSGAGTSCVDVTCPQPMGACCLPSGICISTDMANCTGQSGTFSGAGTLCADVSCPQPMGACCLPSGVCITADMAACEGQGGTFGGVGSDCEGTKCVVPCACDWDQSGKLTSQDFFDFITGFFSDNADFNNDGETTSQDFFDFIACFFTGC